MADDDTSHSDPSLVIPQRLDPTPTPPDDEIGRLIAADPHAHVVEGDTQAWLLTGDQMKVAREAMPKNDQ